MADAGTVNLPECMFVLAHHSDAFQYQLWRMDRYVSNNPTRVTDFLDRSLWLQYMAIRNTVNTLQARVAAASCELNLREYVG